LEAREVVVYRRDARVLEGASLVLQPGEAVALVGPNAAGKSTFLRALAGLLPLAGGSLAVKGRPIGEWSRPALARSLGLVPSGDEGGRPLTGRARGAGAGGRARAHGRRQGRARPLSPSRPAPAPDRGRSRGGRPGARPDRH